MNINQLIPVGNLSKPHGVRGVLKFLSDYVFTQDFLKQQVFFVKQENNVVPYIAEKIEFTGNNIYLITFEDIKSKEAADLIKNKPVLLPKEIAEPLIAEDDFEETFAYLEGYELQNENKEPVGVIEEVITMPQHELAKITLQQREVLIPLEEDLIIDIDDKKKIVVTMIPVGLLDIYLE